MDQVPCTLCKPPNASELFIELHYVPGISGLSLLIHLAAL